MTEYINSIHYDLLLTLSREKLKTFSQSNGTRLKKKKEKIKIQLFIISSAVDRRMG